MTVNSNTDLSQPARDFSVLDRVVIVTGAGQGIGRELARQFAAAGAVSVVADLSLDNANGVAAEINASGGQALALQVDVSKKASVEAMVAGTLKAYGRVEVLVNNASLFSALVKRPFDQITEVEWQRVMDVNVNGVFFCTCAVVQSMRDQGFGRVINISSASVHRGTKNYLHYVTSKSALIGMTNSIAREVGADGITVNCIRPGTVATEVAERVASLTPEIRQRNIDLQCIPRTIVPSDLVGLTMFLSTPAAAFITGQTMACDGGYTHSF